MDLKRIFNPPRPPAKFPDGRVGYAVGDVHGRADLLAELIGVLEERAVEDTREGGPPFAIFVGDYIDRGPNSAAVIDLLLRGHPRGFERRFLKGNHEASMLAFMDDPMANRSWVLHGGTETLVSYGVQPPISLGADEADWLAVATALKAKVPAAHMAFLAGLERFIVLGDYAFVHAGVDRGRPIEDQQDGDLLWARAKFLADKRSYSHRIVHGHTPADRPFVDWRRIGVDTGAYASGTLSAVRLEGEDVSFISVSDRALRR